MIIAGIVANVIILLTVILQNIAKKKMERQRKMEKIVSEMWKWGFLIIIAIILLVLIGQNGIR